MSNNNNLKHPHASQFTSLPTEALIHIFKNVDISTLLSLTATCKKFKDVILNSKEFNKTSHITVDFEKLSYSKLSGFTCKSPKKDFDALLRSDRNIESITVYHINHNNLTKLEDKWLDIFKKFKDSIKNLRIKSDFRLDALGMILELLTNLNACDLDGFRIYKTSETSSNDQTIIFNNMKHLSIKNFQNGTQIFNLFKNCSNLKTLSVSSMFLKRDNMPPDFFDTFLSNQNRLDTLELHSVDSGDQILFYEDISDKVLFELKKLTFDYNGFSANLQNFKKFLHTQKDIQNLKLHLSLSSAIGTTDNNGDINILIEECKCVDEIFKFVLCLRRLNSLNIFVDNYSSKNDDTFNVINRVVTSFVYEDENRKNNRLLMKFLKCFPNLKCLELAIFHYSDELLELISTYLKRLEHIKIVGYYSGILARLDCIDLKSVTVKYAYATSTKEDWIQFIRHNPNVTKITVENCMDFIDDETVETITHNLPLLKHFETIDSYSNNLTEAAYKIFRNNCPRLKYLKLTGTSSSTRYQTIEGANRINITIVVVFYIIAIICFTLIIFLMLYEVI